MATGSYDQTVRLWPAFPDAVSAMCAKLTTNMNHQQWRDWVSRVRYVICPDLPIRGDDWSNDPVTTRIIPPSAPSVAKFCDAELPQIVLPAPWSCLCPTSTSLQSEAMRERTQRRDNDLDIVIGVGRLPCRAGAAYISVR
jgi:hypothetical protein